MDWVQPWEAPARDEWKEGESSWSIYCSGYFPDWAEETGDVLQRYWLFITTEMTAFSLHDSFISYCGNHCSLSLLGVQSENSFLLKYRNSTSVFAVSWHYWAIGTFNRPSQITLVSVCHRLYCWLIGKPSLCKTTPYPLLDSEAISHSSAGSDPLISFSLPYLLNEIFNSVCEIYYDALLFFF